MFKFLVFGLVLALIQLIGADQVNYSDCGSTIGTVSNVTIVGCNTNMGRCILKRNTNATVNIEFTPAEAGDDIKINVHGILLDVPVPFAMPNPNACLDSGIECPVKPKQTYLYTATLPILKKYPRVTVDIKMELQKNNTDFACVLIPAKLQ